jgi:hypothetical protein
MKPRPAPPFARDKGLPAAPCAHEIWVDFPGALLRLPAGAQCCRPCARVAGSRTRTSLSAAGLQRTKAQMGVDRQFFDFEAVDQGPRPLRSGPLSGAEMRGGTPAVRGPSWTATSRATAGAAGTAGARPDPRRRKGGRPSPRAIGGRAGAAPEPGRVHSGPWGLDHCRTVPNDRGWGRGI